MEIIVRIVKQNPWTNLTKWDKCFDYIGSYWTRSGNLYTGLTAEDAERLEKELRYEPGTLSPSSSFWETYAVKVGKKDTILRTEKPEDELKYLFLKGHKRVADGINKQNAATDYLLINATSEAEETNKFQ